MKRLFGAMLCVFFLIGCTGKSEIEKGLLLRTQLQSGNGCEFNATVTADYGTELYTFSTFCKADDAGNVSFAVTAPESIAGITGTLNSVGGALTFEDEVLVFPVLADRMISPVSAPWFFITALRSGYVKACEENKDGLHLVINDTYAQDAIQIDIYTDPSASPIQAEFLWQGRRILTLAIENYTVV